jgi:guanine deaminase
MAKAELGKKIIRGGRLVDLAQRRAEPADILVIDGIISEVGRAGAAAPDDAVVFDATGMLIHPGLINAHTHAQGGLGRSPSDRWTLELQLANGGWLNGFRTTEEKYLSALICAAEMASKGCTAAYDLHGEAPLPTAEGMDAVASAYAEVGMRAVVAPMVSDLSLYQAIPGLMEALPADLQREAAGLQPADGEACLAAMAKIVAGWRWAGQDIRVALAPTIPLHCSEKFVCGCARLARENGVRLHTHVGESKVQAVSGIKRYGRTLLQQMDHWGLVGPDFTAAHAVWLDDDDLRIMADKGASIAHNPGSNLRLGNGLANFRRMRDFGVCVGLGTDGSSCSDNQNMYEAMRFASFVARGRSPDTDKWMSVDEVFAAATVGSAAALGFSDIGEVRAGFKADLVFLDLTALNWIPHNWSVNQMVHAEDGTSVRHVMIGGRLVVRDGKLLTVDLAKLAADVERARERREVATAPMRELAGRLGEVVNLYCPGLAAEPYRVENYVE